MEPINHGEAAQNSRKRKMKEIVAADVTPTPPPTVHSRHPVRCFPMHQPSNAPRLSLNINHPSALSYNQNSPFRFDLNSRPTPIQNLSPTKNTAFSIQPVSFTSLLTADDDQPDLLLPFIKEQNAHIDKSMATLGDQLKRSLAEVQRRQYCSVMFHAEERADKKLKEKDLELSKMASQKAALEQTEVALHREIQNLQSKMKALERENTSLRLDLQKALILGGKFESSGYTDENEDVESANVDPARRVEPVLLVCKVCSRQVANVMMWPCRHVCLCKDCGGSVRACPVCKSRSTNNFEIYLKDER